ncbi:hypothetical protein GBAR_LOCUS12005, partial [Geodia barretti]
MVKARRSRLTSGPSDAAGFLLLLTMFLVAHMDTACAQATIMTSTLDLDDNVLVLEFASLDMNLMVDCTKLRLGSTVGGFSNSQPLSNPATVTSMSATVSCPLGTDLKIAIETDDNFGTTSTDTVLFIESGNGINDTGNELDPDMTGMNVSMVDSDD